MIRAGQGNLPAFFVCGDRMEHKDIPDNQRHEPRGASTASNGQAVFSNGDGSTSFRYITASDISGLEFNGYNLTLGAASTAVSQNPAALDTALQVEFGPAQTTPDATLTDTGTLTFTASGEYLLTIFLRFGRTSGTGTAIVLNRLLLNDVQYLRSNAVAMSDLTATVPFSATILISAQAGDTFKMQIARDSSGVNNGGLVRTVPTTLPWQASPSASLAVFKLGG